MQPNSWAGSRQSVCRGQQSARRHYRSTGTIATGGSCNPDPRWGHKTPTSHPLRAASGSSSEGPALLRQHNRCNSTNSGSNGSGRGSSSSTWAPFGVQRGRSTPGVARGHGGAPAGATTRQLLSSPAPGASPAPPFITSSWPALQPPFSYLATAEDAISNSVPCGLPPLWKMLLLSDGSVTRHLQLLSGAPVAVDCLSMCEVGDATEGFPPGTELIPGPRVQRQVLLRCQPPPLPATANASTTTRSGPNDSDAAGGKHSADRSNSSSSSAGNGGGFNGSNGGGGGVPLVYASSWWPAATVDRYLADRSQPIWMSLSQGHVELYREVHGLYCGTAPERLRQLLELGGSGGGGEEEGAEEGLWGRQYIFWSGGQPLTLIYEVFSSRLSEYVTWC